jgi:hypothetical protein
MSLQFTAERSLGTARSLTADPVQKGLPAITRTSETEDRARVVPQLTVTGCGSPLLNASCRALAIPAWAPCESWFWWNQGAAGRCMYVSMVAAAPWCGGCTVIAP